MELLSMKYIVPESSLCTRVGNDKADGTIYVSGKGYVPGCYVSQYPVYVGTSWEDALAIAQRIPKLIVSKKLVPQEYQPTGYQVTTSFDGVYGCERFKADSYLLLWHNPARALRLLTLRAKREAGLIKPRELGIDYYRLLMECLRTVVSEHESVFHLPRKFQDVIKIEQFAVKIVGKRSKCKDDPSNVMEWVLQCHSLYRLMDRGAFKRLGKARYYYSWCRPPMTYRKAIKTLVRDDMRMKECVKRYFKPRKWKPFFAWVKREARRLERRTAQIGRAAVMNIAA
jgi:hypothetical protein